MLPYLKIEVHYRKATCLTHIWWRIGTDWLVSEGQEEDEEEEEVEEERRVNMPSNIA